MLSNAFHRPAAMMCRSDNPIAFMLVTSLQSKESFLGASRDPGRRNGGVMRNPNYTYADTRQPSPDDEGQQESPHLSI